ncbi:hypothetical protein PA6_024_00230 [Aquipseudomonas alcaligenes NBRC 14159]|uniref:Uncharacterized protein n=1 Tax=Aquipseudomonas alcaligenes (strain ATCC 14909 / DSM 50342 / CCUG 1425 / JCM 20561 / NBRC 14159 / NCIMB 9945 / NCTC 10367 / 1577) TaxID=1215092 RepID=U2ZQV1_AQUA1|nr:hypothetical protein PA6_024_00230 [Pseudomonas alcaligenes NBRC 14159]
MTALREVRETGYEVEIVDVLPGLFKGGLSTNAYFVMRHIGPQGKFDWKTQATRWVDFEQAEALIGLTHNPTGRLRDLALGTHGRSVKAVRGPDYWCFQGETLAELRRRK